MFFFFFLLEVEKSDSTQIAEIELLPVSAEVFGTTLQKF